eukprot:5663277-Amphidinium_carterae.1
MRRTGANTTQVSRDTTENCTSASWKCQCEGGASYSLCRAGQLTMSRAASPTLLALSPKPTWVAIHGSRRNDGGHACGLLQISGFFCPAMILFHGVSTVCRPSSWSDANSRAYGVDWVVALLLKPDPQARLL